MPEITRRRTGEFVRKLFEILLDHPDGMQAGTAINELKQKITLTDYEQGFYASGAQRFDKIVRFATVDCVKAGWLLKIKGRWSVTDEGRLAYKTLPDPETFYRRAVKAYYDWKATRPSAAPELHQEEDATAEKAIRITFEQAEEQAWEEIERYLTLMNPYDFQDLVADLPRAMGYHIAWVAPPGKDAGIDIEAWGDPLGTHPPRIKVQVKRMAQKVAVDGLRSFMAQLGDDDLGIFVCTGGFTRDAMDEARKQEKRRVRLVDLERLFELWVEHYSRLEESARRRLPLKPIHFLAPQA